MRDFKSLSQTKRLSTVRFSFCLVGVLHLMSQQTASAQYKLPKLDILANRGIREIHVSKTPLRMENHKKKDVTEKSFDRTPLNLSTYFISENGRVDSIYHYPNDSIPFHKKDVFRYSDDGLLVESTTTLRMGKVEERMLVERTAENEWYYRQWQHGEIKVEIKSTSDSIVYETIRHRTKAPVHSYMIYAYDLETDIQTETSYRDEEILARDTYQWFSKNGLPYLFSHAKYRLNDGKGKPMDKSREFSVNQTGMIINRLNGQVFDPYGLDNYFDRHERFIGIQAPHGSLFTEDTFTKEIESSELLRFDGTSVIYVYRIQYVERSDL